LLGAAVGGTGLVWSDPSRPAPQRWQDVVNIPARREVTVRMAFDTFNGRTVYHCHVLDHEDNGMMGVLEFRSPA
jgi:FtsP/CotA-like multicopper oxidase with cupredoxin domain